MKTKGTELMATGTGAGEKQKAVRAFALAEIARLSCDVAGAAIAGTVVKVGGRKAGRATVSTWDKARAAAALVEIGHVRRWAESLGVSLDDSTATGAGAGAGAKVENPARRAAEAEAARRMECRKSLVLQKRRALRAAMAEKGWDCKVSMAPLGERLASPSRKLIDKGGDAGENEARECRASFRQRVEESNPLAWAAGELGKRFGWRWVQRKEAATGLTIEPGTRDEVVALFRFAGITAVMEDGADGLLEARHKVRRAKKQAAAEVRRAAARDGLDVSLDAFCHSAEWEERLEFHAQGSMPGAGGRSSDPARGAGFGDSANYRDFIGDAFAKAEASFQARIAKASTPQAKAAARRAAGGALELVAALVEWRRGGVGPSVELMRPFFPDGALDEPITGKGRVALHRLRARLG